MKKTILTLVAVGVVAAAGLQSAKAGDHGWSVAGQVLTGITAASIVASAFVPPPTYYTYSAPPVVYSAPRAPVYAAPAAPAYVTSPTVVYVAPRPPVVVYRAPVYRAPVYAAPVYAAPVYAAPAVNVSFRFGGGYHHYYRHGYW